MPNPLALRSEKSGRHTMWVFACVDCGKEVRRNVTKAKRDMAPKCFPCSRRSRPFQHVYTKVRLTAAQMGRAFSLTYEDVCRLATTPECHYCLVAIPWEPWSTSLRKYPKGYFLDRKDNDEGYHLDNVVVCCTDCNRLRGARFSYTEMQILSPALKRITESRIHETTEFD